MCSKIPIHFNRAGFFSDLELVLRKPGYPERHNQERETQVIPARQKHEVTPEMPAIS